MVMEKDSDFTDLNKEICKTLEQIEEKSSSFLDLSLEFDYIVESLEKKEEQVRVVEAREKEVALLEESVSEKARLLEEKEMDFDMIQVLEASLLRLVIETQTEEAVRKRLEDVGNECERKKEEARLVINSINEKLCELEKAEGDFDVKQRVEMERVEARKKEVDSVEEAIKVIHAELKREEERFEVKKKEEADKWREETQIKEKKLEEMMKELNLKQMELEERSKQQFVSVETRKRSNHEVEPSLTPHAKKHKSEEADLVCVSNISKDKRDEDTKLLTCPDTKFDDVGKSMSSFALDQVWALYDPRDNMPRIYAQIRRIFSSQLSLQVTLLEHVETIKEERSIISSACGRFEYGDTEIKRNLMFAHEMDHTKCGKSVIINPRKGETWALLRDCHSDLLEPPYRYDLVEVITEFDDQLGISVAYKGRVEGFDEQHGLIKIITPGEMQRFSHKVASVKLGEEREEVPAGSLKLDSDVTPGCGSVLEEEEVETSMQSQDCGKGLTVETQEGSTKDQPIILE